MTDIDWFISKQKDMTVNDLVLGVLRRGFSSSFEELVKTSGAADALAATKPQMKIAYHSFFEATKKAIPIKGNEADAMLSIFQMCHAFMVPTDQFEGVITDKGGVETLHSCPFQNNIPEICIHLSHYSTGEICERMNPDYECIFTHHLTAGDPYCRCVFKKKSDPAPNPDNIGNVIEKLPPLEIPEEQLVAMRLGGTAMQWNGITSAFVNLNGVEKTKEVLYENARRVGREAARKVKELMPNAGSNAETLGQMAQAMCKALNQRGSPNFVSEEEFVMQITDCPCQTFSPEFCGQHGILIDGIIEVLNPAYEFVYDRMMTKGDKTCHWTIRRKARTPSVVQSAQELLKERLVRGEINEEDYRRMKELID